MGSQRDVSGLDIDIVKVFTEQEHRACVVLCVDAIVVLVPLATYFLLHPVLSRHRSEFRWSQVISQPRYTQRDS